MLLKDKTAVVTGCNRGIGREIIKSFFENILFAIWIKVSLKLLKFEGFIESPAATGCPPNPVKYSLHSLFSSLSILFHGRF